MKIFGATNIQIRGNKCISIFSFFLSVELARPEHFRITFQFEHFARGDQRSRSVSTGCCTD